MKLIPKLTEAHRFWSVRLAGLFSVVLAVLAIAPDVWASLPDDARALLPHGLQAAMPAIMFAATLVARLFKQKDRTDGH